MKSTNGNGAVLVGTPERTTIPTSVFQAIVDIIDFGTDASTAVNASKFHQKWLPEYILVEEDFPNYKIKALEKMGYTFKKTAKIGRTEMILVDKDGS